MDKTTKCLLQPDQKGSSTKLLAVAGVRVPGVYVRVWKVTLLGGGLGRVSPGWTQNLRCRAAAKEDREKTVDLRGHQDKEGLKEVTKQTQSSCDHMASAPVGLGTGPPPELC